MLRLVANSNILLFGKIWEFAIVLTGVDGNPRIEGFAVEIGGSRIHTVYEDSFTSSPEDVRFGLSACGSYPDFVDKHTRWKWNVLVH